MQKVFVDNQNKMRLPYTVRSYRGARRVRVTVAGDGTVRVSKPARVSFAQIEVFMRQQFGWIVAKVEEFQKKPQKLLRQYSRKEFEENREKARTLVTDRLAHFNQFYNYKISRVSIRNQRGRWGSCSSKGNLNFNYKIVFLPIELADYIIVHELCHLGQMDHSPVFWSLVARHIPNYKECRSRLRAF